MTLKHAAAVLGRGQCLRSWGALCRFLTNLPPHMQHLNYTLVQTLVPVGLQSVEEIEAIVHQATRPSVWPNWPPQQQQQQQARS